MRQSDIGHLFRSHGPEVERFLFRHVACTETAADLTQETFSRLLRYEPASPIDNARALLFKIAANLAKDHKRKAQRQRTDPVPVEDLARFPDHTPTTETAISDKETLDILLNAVSQLPPRTRDIFVLHRIKGLTYSEVAKHMNVSESTVQKHLTQALAYAMSQLRRRDPKK